MTLVNNNVLQKGMSWETERQEACAAIEARAGFLKIVTKVKNDLNSLRRWIEHFSAIVGYKNLIIFDNMSDDADLLAFYQVLPRDIVLVTYAGWHNNLHNISIFPELYAALARSCEFFGFFDVDERVALFVDGVSYDAKEFYYFIMANRSRNVILTTWLDNAIRSPSKFYCSTADEKLIWGLSWGKPILRSNAKLDGIILHNVQVPSGFVEEGAPLNCFCLHEKNLDPKRRIKANVTKLVARGFASVEDTTDQILDRNVGDVSDPLIIMYINEIRKMSGVGYTEDLLTSGHIKILEDGRIQYYSYQERSVFHNFLAMKNDLVIREVFSKRRIG